LDEIPTPTIESNTKLATLFPFDRSSAEFD